MPVLEVSMVRSVKIPEIIGRTQLELEIVILEQILTLLEQSTNSYRKFDSKVEEETGVVTLGGAYTGGKASLVWDMIWSSGWVYADPDPDVPWTEQLASGHGFIDNLSEGEAHDLLSFFCRGDKWSDGYFGYRVEDGSVKATVLRLQALKKKRCRDDLNLIGTEVCVTALRADLVRTALIWQDKFGVAPSITSTLSEFDAANLVGMPIDKYSSFMQDKTAVSKGSDFNYKGVRYQVKANRPSGKPGSFVTLVSKATNYNWDQLIWILYNEVYEPQEAWLWHVDAYIRMFDAKKRLSPNDYRKGIKLDLGSLSVSTRIT